MLSPLASSRRPESLRDTIWAKEKEYWELSQSKRGKGYPGLTFQQPMAILQPEMRLLHLARDSEVALHSLRGFPNVLGWGTHTLSTSTK
jgi:hypothetical protein